MSPNTKLNITLTLLVALVFSLLGATWAISKWVAIIEMRVQRLEEDKCPCGDFFQRSPPDTQR